MSHPIPEQLRAYGEYYDSVLPKVDPADVITGHEGRVERVPGRVTPAKVAAATIAAMAMALLVRAVRSLIGI